MSAAAALQTAAPKPVASGSANVALKRKCACGGSAGLTAPTAPDARPSSLGTSVARAVYRGLG